MAKGRKTGGRRRGTPNKATAEIRGAAQQYTKEALEVLVQVARNGQSDAARVSAACALLDRGHGRPTQAVAGEEGTGPVTFVVHTGVPERE